MAIVSDKTVTISENEALNTSGFVKSMRTDKTYRRKCFITLCCAFAYAMYGWQYGQIGPALPELQRLLQVELETISWILTCQNIGLIVSGFIFSFLYDRFNRFTVISICLIGARLFHGIFPLSTSFPASLGLRLLSGVCNGGIETGMFTIVFAVWGTNAAGFVHSAYFATYIGGIIGPLVTNPFLSNDFQEVRYENKEGHNTINASQSDLNESTTKVQSDETIPPIVAIDDDLNIFYAFVLTGIVTVIVALLFIYMVNSPNYRNIEVKADSSMSKMKQNSHNTVNNTDMGGRVSSNIKGKSREASNVHVKGNTDEIVLGIDKDSLNAESNNADIDFTKYETTDISTCSAEMHIKHSDGETNLAIIGETRNDENGTSMQKLRNGVLVKALILNQTSTINNKYNSEQFKSVNVHCNTETKNALTDDNINCLKTFSLNNSTKQTFKLHRAYQICIVILMDILFFLTSARGVVLNFFLPTFCLKYLNWTVYSSSNILSVYQIGGLVGGVISIFLARACTPTKLLLVVLIGWNVSAVAGYVATIYRIDAFIWISVSLGGFFIAMIPATALSWIQLNVYQISGKISALFTLAGGLGMASSPNVIGFVMQTVSLMFFWYIQIGLAFFGLLAFILAFIIQRQ